MEAKGWQSSKNAHIARTLIEKRAHITDARTGIRKKAGLASSSYWRLDIMFSKNGKKTSILTLLGAAIGMYTLYDAYTTAEANGKKGLDYVILRLTGLRTGTAYMGETVDLKQLIPFYLPLFGGHAASKAATAAGLNRSLNLPFNLKL